MVLSHYEILARLYSIRNTIVTFDATSRESVQMIKDLIDDIEE